MKLYLRNTCSIGALLAWIATSVTYVAAEEEVIWSGTGRLGVGEKIEAQYFNCRLDMNGDGNVVVRRRTSGLDDTVDSLRTSWSTHSIHQDANYTLELISDGNLAVYKEVDDDDDEQRHLRRHLKKEQHEQIDVLHGNDQDDQDGGDVKTRALLDDQDGDDGDDVETRALVWTTNIVGSSSSLHELVIDGTCRLKLKSDGVDVWENIKVSPFKAGQVLQRGEQFRMSRNFADVSNIAHGFELHYVMLLQHDCNLVQFVGTDNADIREKVWKSGTQRPFGSDCYLYLDKGHADLYTGVFNNSLGFNATRPGKIWSTPDGWFSQEGSDSDQENYEILLEYDGSVFTYQVSSEVHM